ncbi:MAG TPA: exonuclease VII large subunit, partial [Xanthobacteraceae bacterium]|nr:exonuclease VII large subunit [Xanthobacteraceae bacterium]
MFWPYAYDDIVSYALWPSDYSIYDGGFWDYAYGNVLGLYGYGYGSGDGGGYASADITGNIPSAGGGTRRSRGSARSPQSQQFADLCGDGTAGITQWPFERIEETIQPTNDQLAALDEFKAAAAKAAQQLQSACPREIPETPLARL